MVLSFLAACAASSLIALAVALQAMEARSVPAGHGLRLSLLGRLARRPRWLGATALAVLAWPLQTFALLDLPLTVVQPIDAAGLLLLLVLGARILHEPVGRRERLAAAGIVLAVTGLAWVAPARSPTLARWQDLAPPLIVLGALGLLPVLARRWAGAHGMVAVVGAGCAFAWGTFATKLIADALIHGDPAALLILVPATAVTGVVAMLSEMTALQHRPATQTAPVIFVIELLVPVALAALVGGEGWSGDPAAVALRVACLAVAAASVILLAAAPAVAGLVQAGSRASSSDPSARSPTAPARAESPTA